MPSLHEHCHRSQDETGGGSGGGPETQARRWGKCNAVEVEVERGATVVCGEEGRQAGRQRGGCAER